MTISTGRTDCKAERDDTIQSFKDFLEIVSENEMRIEQNINETIHSVTSDNFISYEEQLSRKRQYEDGLYQFKSKQERIRQVFLIGLYSFWEISLSNIVKYYKKRKNKCSRTKKKHKNNGKKSSNCANYLNAIYRNRELPELTKIIDGGIRLLRNNFTHGSMSKEQKEKIKELSVQHPEFDIELCDFEVYLSSYKGAYEILHTVQLALDQVEEQAKSNNINL